MGARRRRGGGVPEMGFRAGPLVLCKDGCCHQRRRNTNFGPEKFFPQKIFPHICVVKLISATWGSFEPCMLGSNPPPPPPARQVGQRQPKPPSRHGDQGGGGGGWANGLPCHPPPQSNFLPAFASKNVGFCILKCHTYQTTCGCGPGEGAGDFQSSCLVSDSSGSRRESKMCVGHGGRFCGTRYSCLRFEVQTLRGGPTL